VKSGPPSPSDETAPLVSRGPTAGDISQRRQESVNLVHRPTRRWRITLHKDDHVVVVDAPGYRGDIGGADPLPK
jgi:hypothetical protein